MRLVTEWETTPEDEQEEIFNGLDPQGKEYVQEVLLVMIENSLK